MEKSKLAVICDFDGTATEIDVGHQVYAHFGDERWREVNQSWRRGEMSSKDCLIGEYSFVDASEQEVREHILKMKIDPGLCSRSVKRRSWPKDEDTRATDSSKPATVPADRRARANEASRFARPVLRRSCWLIRFTNLQSRRIHK